MLSRFSRVTKPIFMERSTVRDKFGKLKKIAMTVTAMDVESTTKNLPNLWANSSEIRNSGEDSIALSLGANGRAVIITGLLASRRVSLKIADSRVVRRSISH